MKPSFNSRLLFLFTIAILMIGIASASAEESGSNAGEQIKWQVVGNGATDGSSASYNLKGTVGQPAIGSGSSASYNLSQGFWQNFGVVGECFCGDADTSGGISIGDAVFIINYIFGGGPAPSPLCNGDADGSQAVSIGDAVYIINYIFGGGPAPGGC